MADASSDRWLANGVEVAQNPQAIDIKDGLTATQAGGVVSVSVPASGIGASQIASNAVTTAKIADAAVTPAKTINAAAVTATADGTGTGVIPDTATFVTVTVDDANKIVTLPTPTVGRMVWIQNGATGYELRSNAPSTVLINAGTGGPAVESAIAANSTVLAICTSATSWKAIFLDADADVAKVEAAA